MRFRSKTSLISTIHIYFLIYKPTHTVIPVLTLQFEEIFYCELNKLLLKMHCLCDNVSRYLSTFYLPITSSSIL